VVGATSFLIRKLALLRYETTYKLHLRVRKFHDVLVVKSPSYKKVSEHPYTKPVKRAAITGFFVSPYSGSKYEAEMKVANE